MRGKDEGGYREKERGGWMEERKKKQQWADRERSVHSQPALKVVPVSSLQEQLQHDKLKINRFH